MNFVRFLGKKFHDEYLPGLSPIKAVEAAGSMRRVLIGLIQTGHEFERGDFEFLGKECELTTWIGKGYPDSRWTDYLEDLYTTAVVSQNRSAQRSFLCWRRRPELLLPNSEDPIFVGRGFEWDGETVKCSSFNERKQFITILPTSGAPHRRIRWDQLQIREVDSA